MFDRNLFDRSVYDRSVASDGINISLLSAGHMGLQLIVIHPIPLSPMVGRGILDTSSRVLIPAGTKIEASGNLNNSEVVLHQSLAINLSGSGTVTTLPTVSTPIGNLGIVGSGTLKSVDMFAYQHMDGRLISNSDISVNSVMQQHIDIIMSSISAMGVGNLLLKIPMTFNLGGDGSIELRRLGTLNEDLFQLSDITLMPGEEVTIDTDLFDVIFNYRSDVSSVTTDSVFFDLSPGENELVVATDTEGSLQITAIWQNRWL